MNLLTQIALSLVISVSHAKSFNLKEVSGSTIFKATALGLKFEGKGSGPYGSAEFKDHLSGELTFNLDSLNTGIDLRNTHMKENYLETGKFPRGKLIVDNIEGFNLTSPDGTYKFSGKLVLRDISKAVKNATAIIKKTATGYDIEAQFDTKLSDFSIPLPKYAGLALKDDIQVLVKTTAVETNQ